MSDDSSEFSHFNIQLYKTFWSFVVYVVVHAGIDVWKIYSIEILRLNTLYIGSRIKIFSS